MKYKLIKCYPGSPELGTIVYFNNNRYYFNEGALLPSHINPKDYPDFWQHENEWVNKEDIQLFQNKLNTYDFDTLSAYEVAIIAEEFFRTKYKLHERTT